MNNLIRNLVKSLAKLNQTFNGTLVNQTEISRQQRKIKQIENDFQSFIDTVQSAKDELDDVTLARMSNFLDSAIKGITGIHDLVDGMVENHRKINSDYRSLPVIKGLKRKLTIDLVNLHELRMKENDIFLLETIGDLIIINYNYKGILVLDHALNVTKEINIFDDLIINRCYKEFSDRALLFFSYENNCLIHLDVTTWEVTVIELEGEMHFSPLYWWDTRDEVILVTYKRELFKLSLKDKSLTEISKEELHKDTPELYRLIVDYKNVAITHFFPHEHILLSQDQEEHKLIIYNYKKHTQEWMPCFLETTHDFLYRKGMKVFIHEERLDVCYEPTTGGTVDSEELYIFGRACFLNDSKIVVLKVDQSCNYGNMLAIYDLKD